MDDPKGKIIGVKNFGSLNYEKFRWIEKMVSIYFFKKSPIERFHQQTAYQFIQKSETRFFKTKLNYCPQIK